MKTLIVAASLLLSSTFLMAEPVIAEGVDAGKAAAELKCIKACLIMDEADVAVLSAQIQAEMEKAYQAGLAGWSKAAALGGE